MCSSSLTTHSLLTSLPFSGPWAQFQFPSPEVTQNPVCILTCDFEGLSFGWSIWRPCLGLRATRECGRALVSNLLNVVKDGGGFFRGDDCLRISESAGERTSVSELKKQAHLLYNGCLNRWIHSPIPISCIYQLNFATPAHCPVYFPYENYTKQWGFRRVSLLIFLQGRYELMMKSMWMAQWKRTWVKVEKAQGQMMK